MSVSRASVRALWGFASWLIPLLVVFLLTPRLLQLLGPERFGVLMVALVTPVIASQIDLGLAASAVRRLAADLTSGQIDGPRTLAPYLVAFFALALVFGALVGLASGWLADTLGFSTLLGADSARTLIRWCALWGAVSLATALPALIARAAQSFAWLTATQTFATLTLWIGAVLLISADRPLHEVVALGVLVSALAAVAMAWTAWRVVHWDGAVSWQLPLHNGEMGFAGGMFASQVASAIAFQGDRILISSLGSPAIAGAYALCANLANKPLAAVVAITSFAYPHAAGLHAGGEKAELAALLHALDRAVAVLILPLLLPALWLIDTFLHLWLGAYGTADLAVAFNILLIAFALAAFAVPVGHVLAASGNAKPAALFSWLTATVMIAAIVALVPAFGLVGAAVAILAAMSTSLLFRLVAIRTLQLKPPEGRVRFWAGVSVGLATQAAALHLLAPFAMTWWTLLFVGAAGWVGFFLSRAMFRTLSPEETRLLGRLRRRFLPMLAGKY